jgi:hypothetical protein
MGRMAGFFGGQPAYSHLPGLKIPLARIFR